MPYDTAIKSTHNNSCPQKSFIIAATIISFIAGTQLSRFGLRLLCQEALYQEPSVVDCRETPLCMQLANNGHNQETQGALAYILMGITWLYLFAILPSVYICIRQQLLSITTTNKKAVVTKTISTLLMFLFSMIVEAFSLGRLLSFASPDNRWYPSSCHNDDACRLQLDQDRSTEINENVTMFVIGLFVSAASLGVFASQSFSFCRNKLKEIYGAIQAPTDADADTDTDNRNHYLSL